MELIDKSKLIAKIERRRNKYINSLMSEQVHILNDILSDINSLETTEVDLKEERMKDCPYRVVGCEKYLGTVTDCNGACAWVVDYLTLKELKAKKGE